MFKTNRINDYVLEIDGGKVGKVGWQHKTLAMFDQHRDSDHHRKDLFEKGLQDAKEGGHPAFFGGDLFDAMQSRNDPRRARGSSNDEKKKYINYLVDEVTEYVEPYAEVIVAWFMGNHETAVLRNLDFDLVSAVIGKLKDRTGYEIQQMGYSGYLVYAWQTRSSCRGNSVVWVHHGYGGNAPISKGTNHVGRRAAAYPDADIIVTGHTHECWSMPHAMERLTRGGNVYKQVQWHVQIPSLKDETRGKKGSGWAVEKGFTPQVNGYGWLKFERVAARSLINVVPTQPELVLENI